MYPNPAQGAARLSFAVARPTTATVRVYDNAGRLVAIVAAGLRLAAGPQLLALPALPAGLYLVRVVTSETQEAVRFVVAQ